MQGFRADNRRTRARCFAPILEPGKTNRKIRLSFRLSLLRFKPVSIAASPKAMSLVEFALVFEDAPEFEVISLHEQVSSLGFGRVRSC